MAVRRGSLASALGDHALCGALSKFGDLRGPPGS